MPKYNVDDDDAAYLYLAKRLLSTGGLIDPSNTRRLTSYGGATLYHAMFLQVSGNSTLRGFEWTFGALLLVLVTLRTVSRRWLALGALVVGLGVVVGNGSGLQQNLSPTLTAAAFSLGAYQLLRSLRVVTARQRPALYVALGLFVGALLALRFYYVVSVVVGVVVVLVVDRRARALGPLAACAAVAVVSVAGWAVALERSSGTPLFPLLPGNYNTAYPVGPSPFSSGLVSYARRVWSVSNGFHVGTVALLAIAVGVILAVLRRRRADGGAVLVAAGIGCLVQLFFYTVVFSGFGAAEIDRFEAPSTLACGLFVLDVLWSLPLAAAVTGLRGRAAADARAAWTTLVPRLAPVIGALAAAVVVAVITFDVSPSQAWSSARTDARLGTHVLAGTRGFTDRLAAQRAQYVSLNAAIPAGAHVFSAVDEPSLMSFSRYTFATLDLAGSASPPPHMPFFQGADADVRYLRAQGFDYIAADSPTAKGLYQLAPWQYDLYSHNFNYRAWAPYFIDWSKTVTTLEHDPAYAVGHFGSLSLIDIGTR